MLSRFLQIKYSSHFFSELETWIYQNMKPDLTRVLESQNVITHLFSFQIEHNWNRIIFNDKNIGTSSNHIIQSTPVDPDSGKLITPWHPDKSLCPFKPNSMHLLRPIRTCCIRTVKLVPPVSGLAAVDCICYSCMSIKCDFCCKRSVGIIIQFTSEYRSVMVSQFL